MNENDLRRALGHLEKGDWRAAHEIVQQDEASALACWAHGIVHLMEGDASNDDVGKEIAALSASLRK